MTIPLVLQMTLFLVKLTGAAADTAVPPPSAAVTDDGVALLGLTRGSGFSPSGVASGSLTSCVLSTCE